MPPGPPSGEALGALRRLYPDAGVVRVRELLNDLDPGARAHPDRPYTVVNFVASADGHAAFRGRSRWLSDEADRELFHGLRERVDAVMAGTGTLREERYGRMVRDPERRRRRAKYGLTPDPLAVVISRSGEVPTDIPLFSDPGSRVVVFTPTALETSGLGADVEVVGLDPGELTLTTMMRRLRSAYDVRSLLCEGGPTLFGALLQENLVDELFLSLAPKLTGGGTAPAITAGPELAELRTLSLLWALELDGALYLRYALTT
ncbi:MAG TPA: dihydrofolate reductase family protein [Solirubrobacteraceae bacterium]|nr:dihydrofolate reductase family protein [Solirubrobacteraceae bacterium]